MDISKMWKIPNDKSKPVIIILISNWIHKKKYWLYTVIQTVFLYVICQYVNDIFVPIRRTQILMIKYLFNFVAFYVIIYMNFIPDHANKNNMDIG